MINKLRIHIVQMTSAKSLAENLDYIAHQFQLIEPEAVDIVVLPEMFAQFGVADQKPLADQEKHFTGPVGQLLRDWAKKLKAWVVAGTVPVAVPEDKRPVARCHVIDPSGNIAAHYDKIHLFDALVADKQGRYRESDSYSPGSNPVVFASPWGKIGLAVCYDLRFPEIFRQLNDAGAEVVILPSAFTAKTGQAHWEVLSRARAIENGFFMVSVNQCGEHDSHRSTWGHSMVVDPWGNVTDLGAERCSQTIELDLTKVDDIRNQLPVNSHRRL